MRYPFGNQKERDTMGEKEILMELEEPLRQIFSGINAVELMVYGLSQVKDPYADGLNAIWIFLQQAETKVQEIMRRVMTANE